MSASTVPVAAVQFEPALGDVSANLRRAARWAVEAGDAGAKVIVLPEFFTSGMAFEPDLAGAALEPDGRATALMVELATRYAALVGGSFLCHSASGAARNRFVLAGSEGVLGWHDKDLPTMWENCFYEPGDDAGIIDTPLGRVGVVLCWEFMRSQTVRRLQGVDLVLGASAWWSVPAWRPAPVWRAAQRRNANNARNAPSAMASLLGVPVVHASLSGAIACRMPLSPVPYRGHFEGGASVVDGHGRTIVRRGTDAGDGIVLAAVQPGAVRPRQAIPTGFWLHKRGLVPAFAWNQQRWHGKRWRQRHNRAQRGTAPGSPS